MWSSSSVSDGVLAALAATLWLAASAAAQDPAACEGVLADADSAVTVLSQVPKYRATYVLVFPDRIAERLAEPEALAEEGVRVGVYAGSEGSAIGGSMPGAVEYDFASDGAGKAIEELLAGNLEAAVLWAPLAGLGILELDFGYDLSMRTFGEPSAVPSFAAAVTLAEGGESSPCAAEVLVLLESYGVLPAEKLVPLHIEDLVLLPPPERNIEAARQGREIYQANCAKCHGQEAVAATDALAPVDLLRSVRRFSYPGFLYIALNGRERNGMPGWRGALSREQVTLVYQYVRERSYGAFEAGGAGATAGN